MTYSFPLCYTSDMSNDECIAMAMLIGAEPYYYGPHSTRPHDVWYVRKNSMLESPLKIWIAEHTCLTGETRYYFISCAEAARAACEFYYPLLQR